MTNEQIVRDAISRSMQHSEIIRVTIEQGEHDDAYMAVHEAINAAVSGEWDCSNENDGSYDCYDTEGEAMAWRINVTVVK